MARFLALDWDAGHAFLLSASLSKSGVSLERAVAWPEEQPPGPGNADAFGQRVRERINEAGLGTGPLLIAVGRDRLILKEVRYPAVPAHEEPGVVRFQAVKELTDAAEDVVLDYQAAETPDPSGERRALAVALRRDLLNAYQTLAKAAGLKLAAVTPRAFGKLAGLRANASPPPEPGTAFAALAISDKGGEFAVARGDHLAFARALSAPALASDNALLGEIRRNLAVYGGQAAQHPVRALYVAEAEGLTIGLADRLRDTLAVPVHRFDPLAGMEPPVGFTAGAFAGAAGLFHLYARSRQLPINFVKPREPKPPKDPNRRLYAVAAAVIGVLVLGAGAWGYGMLAAKDHIIRELAKEKADYDADLTKLEPDRKRIEELDKWTSSGINVLDEIYNLTARFPEPTGIQLTKIEIRPSRAPAAPPGSAASKDKAKAPAADIKLEGIKSSAPTDLVKLRTALFTDLFLKVSGTPTTKPLPGSNRGGGRQFTDQWSLNYGVVRRQPDEYKVELPPGITVPPRRTDRMRGGGGMGGLGDFQWPGMGGGREP